MSRGVPTVSCGSIIGNYTISRGRFFEDVCSSPPVAHLVGLGSHSACPAPFSSIVVHLARNIQPPDVISVNFGPRLPKNSHCLPAARRPSDTRRTIAGHLAQLPPGNGVSLLRPPGSDRKRPPSDVQPFFSQLSPAIDRIQISPSATRVSPGGQLSDSLSVY